MQDLMLLPMLERVEDPGDQSPGIFRHPQIAGEWMVHVMKTMAISGTDNNWRYRFHIFLAYVSGLCKGIYPQNMPVYGTVPPF